jgi:hypothetical protein
MSASRRGYAESVCGVYVPEADGCIIGMIVMEPEE